eukprot:1873993-Prymnesium_polylepis.1
MAAETAAAWWPSRTTRGDEREVPWMVVSSTSGSLAMVAAEGGWRGGQQNFSDEGGRRRRLKDTPAQKE